MEKVSVHRDALLHSAVATARSVLRRELPNALIDVGDLEAMNGAGDGIPLIGAIGIALSRGGPIETVLQECAEAMVEHVAGVCACIWTFDGSGEPLELRACAGAEGLASAVAGRTVEDSGTLRAIAQEQRPYRTDRVSDDAGLIDPKWAGRERLASFAGCPLLVAGDTVGVLGLFGRHLPDDILDTLGAAAGGIGLAIDRQRAERERERAHRELEVERSRLATVFRAAPAFIATLRGPEHVFDMANPAYQRLVGHRKLIGKSVREALPEVEGQGFFELLDRVYRTGEPFVGSEVPVQVQREPGADPEKRFVNFVYQPLEDRSGDTTGILAHGVDVTDMVLARRRVEEQATELAAQTRELQRWGERLEEMQVELELANDELANANVNLRARAEEAERARREAEEASAVTTAFYEAAAVPAALVDRDLRFQRINQALARLYGVSPEEVVGKSLHELAPGYAGQVEPFYRQVLDTGEPIRDLEIEIPHHGNPAEDRHFLVNYFPVRVASGDVIAVGVVALDVTERRHVEEAQRERATVVETIQRVGRSVASELDLESIVQEVTDAATEVTGAHFGAFFYNVVNQAGESYTLYSISGVPREAFSGFPMPRNTPVFGPTFHGTAIVRSDDITRDPRYGQVAPYHGMPEGHLPVTSYLAVPVMSRSGEVLGGLFFGHPEPGRFRERHERLAEGIAGWAAVAMENAKLYGAADEARAEAERANRVKSEFLAIMSHELRTPLNAMIGYTALLLEGVPEPIPEGAHQKVGRIGVSARHLLELIDEILSFSRLEAGEEKVEVETVDFGDVIEQVEALMEPLALEKGIGFDCRAPDEPRSIQTDARKVRQILINLVGNAIKFTDEGEVELAGEQTGDEIVFQVRDTGPGIRQEHLDSVFDPFWQVEGGTTRTAGGTGLGLTVARRLARLLGGDVTVTSEVGEGSTFVFSLPL